MLEEITLEQLKQMKEKLDMIFKDWNIEMN